MKIGITGGTGFIGQNLIRSLDSDMEIIAITSRENCADLVNGNNIHYVHLPYTYKGFKEAFEDCDAIIHLGAVRSSAQNESSIANYYTNITSSEELFKAARDLNINNLINISSIAVYGLQQESPLKEENLLKPETLYGTVKATIEMLAEIYNLKYGMNIKSLRVAQVLGLGERGGYMPAIFLDKSLKGEKLTVYGTGDYGKEYIYIKDLIKAIFCAINNKEARGAFNIGTGGITTNKEFASAYCKAFENPAGFECDKSKPEKIENTFLSIQKSERELNYRPDFTFEEAVFDMKKTLEQKKLSQG